MTIAVTGATGQLGSIIVEKLKGKVPAGEIVALARNTQKAEGLGVEVREADYENPATLDKALAGVDTLMFVSASEIGKRAAQHTNILEAVKKNGVSRIVYTSLLSADTTPISLGEEHVFTEKALRESGIPHTVLRNGWYTENYAGSIQGAVQNGALIGSAGEGKISSASREDFAEAAVAALTTEGHDGKTYELVGDEAFTLSDLAAELSKQTGKEIPYKNLPVDEYAKALVSAGFPEGMASAFAGFDVDAANGALHHESDALSQLIGRPTTPLSKVVSATLNA